MKPRFKFSRSFGDWLFNYEIFFLNKTSPKTFAFHLSFLSSFPPPSPFCEFLYISMPALLFPILPLRFNLTITFAIGVLRISRALRLKLHTLRTIYHSLTYVMFQTAAPRGYSVRLLLCWSATETTETPFFLPPPFFHSFPSPLLKLPCALLRGSDSALV